MKVLVIEDNQKVVKDVCFYLQVRFPDTSTISTSSGLKVRQIADSESPDLIIIDSSLPDLDHLELIRTIRSFSIVPIFVLSDGETDVDQARELEAGADDYIAKPINPVELLARLGALLRRTQEMRVIPDHVISVNNAISVNFTTHEVCLSGSRINLTPLEYKLFSELVRNGGRILTHDIIMEKVWGLEYSSDRRFIKKYIYRLRTKLKLDGQLVTERGIGYRLAKHSKPIPAKS